METEVRRELLLQTPVFLELLEVVKLLLAGAESAFVAMDDPEGFEIFVCKRCHGLLRMVRGMPLVDVERSSCKCPPGERIVARDVNFN